MALESLQQLERLGFPDLLLWLLTFAVVYGVLSQIKKPESAASRLIISVVAGLLVLMSAPASLIVIISNMSLNLVFILVGILVLLIFLEVSGVKVGSFTATPEVDQEGKYAGKSKRQDFQEPFKVHGLQLGIIFIILVALIFIGTGGLNYLGININLQESSTMTIAFLAIVVMAIVFLSNEK